MAVSEDKVAEGRRQQHQSLYPYYNWVSNHIMAEHQCRDWRRRKRSSEKKNREGCGMEGGAAVEKLLMFKVGMLMN